MWKMKGEQISGSKGRRLLSLGLRGAVARMTVPGPLYLGILAFLVVLGGNFTVGLHTSCIWTGVSLTLLRQQQTRWTARTSLAIINFGIYAENCVAHAICTSSVVSSQAHADQLDLVTRYVVRRRARVLLQPHSTCVEASS